MRGVATSLMGRLADPVWWAIQSTRSVPKAIHAWPERVAAAIWPWLVMQTKLQGEATIPRPSIPYPPN
jgi:hypothetical protein